MAAPISEAEITRIQTHMQQRETAWTAHMQDVEAHPDSDPVQTPPDPIDYNEWLEDIESNWNALNRRRQALEAHGHTFEPEIFKRWRELIEYRILHDLDRNALTRQNCIEIEYAAEYLENVTFLVSGAEEAVSHAYAQRRNFIHELTRELHDNEVMTAANQRLFMWARLFSPLENTILYSFDDANSLDSKEQEALHALREREVKVWGKQMTAEFFDRRNRAEAEDHQRIAERHNPVVAARSQFVNNVRQTLSALGDQDLLELADEMLEDYFDPEAEFADPEMEAAFASS